MNYIKESMHRSEKWLRAVASLPCVLCKREGESQAAHVNMGKGMGIKTHDVWTASLCQACHSRIDQGKDMSRADRRALLDSAVMLTLVELAKEGLVKPV